MKKIKLTQSKYAIVDDEDYHYLNRFKWCYAIDNEIEFVMTMITKKSIYMHEMILPTKRSAYLKHRDNNILNNRKSNLELISTSHRRHLGERSPQGYSKYRGVWKRPGGRLWAVIAKDKKKHYLGSFDTEELAALVYNKKAKELYGEFAYQNKIN